MDYGDWYNYDRDTLADIPSRSAERFGESPALAMVNGEPLNYRDLDRLTRRAAALLDAKGIRKGDRVAILSENRPEWCIADFAIARAGAVAVPILTDFPAEQIENILEHSEARAVFASDRLKKKLAANCGAGACTIEVLPIEKLSAPRADEALEAAGRAFKSPAIESNDLAAIVYTSGTTGRSKGVMLTHRNFLADALACRSVVILNEKDVLLSILPLAHTYEYTIGFLIPAMSGASIHYLDRPPSATALLPALASLRPTIMLSVPLVIEKVFRQSVKPSLEKIPLYKYRAFKPFFDRVAGRKLYKTFGGRMRFFGVGGAPLDPEVEAFLLAARFPYAIGYGLTETAPIIAASAVGHTEVKMAGPSIGDAHIRISPESNAASFGPHDVGEVQVRGAMVGPLYYKDPERSAEAMTEDGYFRTGDLGSFDEQGRLFVRGRLKTMILGASGENIYPEEVEAVLNASPYVAESLVYGDDEGLTALIQLKPEIVEELTSCVKEGVAGAEKAAARFGQAVGQAVKHALSHAGSAEQATAQLLERIKKDSNEKLSGFSRIHRIERQPEPFEKTPTQKIKRFLYPKRAGNS